MTNGTAPIEIRTECPACGEVEVTTSTDQAAAFMARHEATCEQGDGS